MTKFIITLVVLAAAGALFFYTQQAEAPTMPVTETPKTQETPSENPFGEDAPVVGEMVKEEPAAPDTGAAPVETKESGITRAELGKHNTQSDCWIAYKGVVYDVTNWLPRHPGSAAAIAPFCGTAEEFAAAFNRQHGTSREGRLEREGVEKGEFVQ